MRNPSSHLDDLRPEDPDKTSAKPREKRERGLRNFLTWSFFLAQAAAAGEFFSSSAKAAEAGDAGGESTGSDTSAARFSAVTPAASVAAATDGGASDTTSGAVGGSAPLPNPSTVTVAGPNPSPAGLMALDGAGGSSAIGGSQFGGSGDNGTLIVISATQVNVSLTETNGEAGGVMLPVELPDGLVILPPHDSGETALPSVQDIVEDTTGGTVFPVVDGAGSLTGEIIAAVGGVLPDVTTPVTGIVAETAGLVDDVLGSVGGTTITVIDGLTEVVGGIVPGLTDIAGDILDLPGGILAGLGDTVSGLVSGVEDTVSTLNSGTGDVLGTVTVLGGDAVDFVGGVADTALNTVDALSDTALDAVGDIAGAGLSLAGGLLDAIGDPLNLSDVVDVAGDLASSTLSFVSDSSDMVLNLTGDTVDAAGNLADTALNTVNALSGTALDAVDDIAGAGLSLAGGLLDAIGDPLTTASPGEALGALPGTTLNFVAATSETAGDFLAGAITAVTSLAGESAGTLETLPDGAVAATGTLLDTAGDLLTDLSGAGISLAGLTSITEEPADLAGLDLLSGDSGGGLFGILETVAGTTLEVVVNAPETLETVASLVTQSTTSLPDGAGGLIGTILDQAESLVASDGTGGFYSLAGEISDVGDSGVSELPGLLSGLEASADTITGSLGGDLTGEGAAALDAVAQNTAVPVLDLIPETTGGLAEIIPGPLAGTSVLESISATVTGTLTAAEPVLTVSEIIAGAPSLLDSLGLTVSPDPGDASAGDSGQAGLLSFLTGPDPVATAGTGSDLMFNGDQYSDLNIVLQTSPADTAATADASADQTLLGGLLGNTLGQVQQTAEPLLSNLNDNDHGGWGRGLFGLFS